MSTPSNEHQHPQRVRAVVTDVDIRFGTMVWLMVKASFAAAIAFLITGALWIGLGLAMAAVTIALAGMLGLGAAGIGSALDDNMTSAELPAEAPVEVAPVE